MSVQRAIVVRKDDTVLATDIPVPPRKQGELLVKVVSTSVNPVDAKIASGAYPIQQYPKVLGGDVAGVVVEADDSSKFKKGDSIFALTDGFWVATLQGTYGEYTVVPESVATPLPSTLALDVAGGLPLVALTAWQAISGANPKPGQKILILGASGGVGHIAVQVAKVFQLHVVAVAGPTQQEFMKTELHADEVVDYRSQKFYEVYADTKFDIVFDLIGSSDAEAAYHLLQPNGYFAHILNTGTDNAFLDKIKAVGEAGEGPKVGVTLVSPNGEQLKAIGDLVDEGKIKLVVHKTIPLEIDSVKEVFQQILTGGGIRGKVVIKVQDP